MVGSAQVKGPACQIGCLPFQKASYLRGLNPFVDSLLHIPPQAPTVVFFAAVLCTFSNRDTWKYALKRHALEKHWSPLSIMTVHGRIFMHNRRNKNSFPEIMRMGQECLYKALLKSVFAHFLFCCCRKLSEQQNLFLIGSLDFFFGRFCGKVG